MKWVCCLVLAACVPDLVAAKKSLRAAVDDQEDDLAACYAKSLQRDAEARGELVVTLHVTAAEGRVEEVKTTRSELGEPDLEKCAKGILRKVRVKPVPSADFDIDYTLQFGEAENKADDDETPKPKPKSKSTKPAREEDE